MTTANTNAAATGSQLRDHATEFYGDAEAIAIEDSIWWARGRRSIIRSFLDRVATKVPHRILEIGCGSGGDLATLGGYGKVWGIERSGVLANRARARGVAVDIYEADFFAGEVGLDFDLFCLFDVLEHIEDDDDFVRRLGAATTSGHLLLMSVPACQFLFGPHDELLHHYRRYSRGNLEALLEKHGFEIVRSSYFMFLLFPVAVLSRLLEGLRHRFGHKKTEVNIGRVPGPVNWIFTAALRFEAWLSRFVRFPIGLWAFVLARKK